MVWIKFLGASLEREEVAFDQLTNPTTSFVEFMQSSPLKGVKLNIKRNKSLTRDVNLLTICLTHFESLEFPGGFLIFLL